MPNTGRPSKDCHECRRRRVKCTLERPECHRCIRLGKRCPGYRDEQSLMFRHEDTTSLGGPSAARDRRRSKSEGGLGTDSSGDTTPKLGTTTPPNPGSNNRSFRGIDLAKLDNIIFDDHHGSGVFAIPLSDWTQYAVPVVLALFSYEAQNQRHFVRGGILPELLSKCSDDSCLIMCCEALGIAYLANRFNSVEAETLRDQAYIRALAATNVLVGDPILCQQDEVAISVWILSLYEIIANSQNVGGNPTTVTWSIHAQGQTELVRLRGPSQLETPIGRGIFWLLVMATQMRCLITKEGYPSFIHDWLSTTQAVATFTDIQQSFFRLSVFVRNLSFIATKIREAQTLEDSRSYTCTIKTLWKEVLAQQPSLNQAIHNDDAQDATQSLQNQYISNLYQASYISTLHQLSNLVTTAQARNQGLSITELAELETIASQIRTITQTLASAIISSASMVLSASHKSPTMTRVGTSDSDRSRSPPQLFDRPICWFDVLELLWPLRTIRACRHLLLNAQVDALEGILRQMSDDFGIRQAVAS